MITQLLRRLQGRPAPGAPAARPAAPEAGHAAPGDFDAGALDRRFLLWALGLREGVDATAEATDAAYAQLQAVAARFDVRRMPRLPALVPQLLAEMRRERADVRSLAAIIERDPTLVGDVMRVAGSAFYQRAQHAAGLQQAVRAIGHEGLRHVVLSSVMRPILRGDAQYAGFAIAARLWSHTEATAWLCGRLASGQCDVAAAQLAGVVAGTGLVALSRMVPVQVLSEASASPDFAPRLHALAGPLAARAAAHWQLPPEVQEALRSPRGKAPSSAVAGVLRGADRLAMVHCLVEADRPADADADASCAEAAQATAGRSPLLAEMVRELGPRMREPVAIA